MFRHLGINKFLWRLVAILSLIAALVGLLNPSIYGHVVSTRVMPGVLSQDLMTIASSIILLLLIVGIKEGDTKKQVIILGIIGFLFYAYGVYAIERLYNLLYFLYLAIFGLSFYTIVYGVASIRPEVLTKTELPNLVRNISIAFLLIIPLIFVPLWTSQLIPLIQAGRKIEFMYSIYILDLCFEMPLFAIIAVMTARRQGLGLLFTPALFIKGFTVLLPLAVGELLKPIFNLPVDLGGMWFYLVLSVLFLVLAVIHLWKLRIKSVSV